MDKKLFLGYIFGCFLFVGSNARMTISPSSLTVVGGGGTTDSTTLSAQYLELSCLATYISGTVYTMNIRRNLDPLAEIIRSDSSETASLSSGVPSDISSKQPTIEGNVRSGSSSYLRVTYLRDRIDCRDGVTYYCIISYGSGGQSQTSNTSASLTVTVIPGNLQILGYRIINGYPSQVLNQSIVQQNDNLQLTCEGVIGSTSSPVIEWYRRTASTSYQVQFQRLYATTNNVGIQDGTPTMPSICHYARTSTLTYTVTSGEQGLGFQCQVYYNQRAYSQEFMFTFDAGTSGADLQIKRTFNLVIVCLIATLLSLGL